MSLSLLPCATIWLALFAAAAFAWQRPLHVLSIALAALGYAAALAFGKLEPIVLAPIALLVAAAWGVAPGRPFAVRIGAHVVFAALAIALTLHLIPGFHNPRVIAPTRFTPDAVPFTMYLNFDKPLVGLWLLWALPWTAPDVPPARALRTGAVAAVATAAACLA
ncbi:CPBP family intramembrane metalloprotease domain-containing protein, partial [Burkholderia diffusa]